MGMAAILVMQPSHDHLYKAVIHHSHEGSRFDLALIGKEEVSKRLFENNVIYMYKAPGHLSGADKPQGSIFFINIHLLSIWLFAASFAH